MRADGTDLPVVHYVSDDGSKKAEQHDSSAGIHDRVQEVPRVWWERQHLLQILQGSRKRQSVPVLNCFGSDIIKDSWESSSRQREAE